MASKRNDRKWTSADELVRQLERDPEYQTRIAEIERRRLALVERNLQDAQPLLAQLAGRGFEVHTPADLFNKRMNYRSAIPTLIEWLPRISNPDLKADVARALSVKWAKPAPFQSCSRSSNGQRTTFFGGPSRMRWTLSLTTPPLIRSHVGRRILSTETHD